ncbi:MAG: hypothetical protein GXO91_01835 [FCB group bacterium]|nr:hypothetical protein [FCB group bacterium]
MRKFYLFPLLFFFLAAQNQFDALRPFFGFNGSQSLQSGVGLATVAAGDLIPGFSYNPANLGLQRFTTITSNFTNGQYTSGVNGQSESGFGGIYAAMPLPVYQGSLVLGFGIHKETDFSGSYSADGVKTSENGGIYMTSFGAAIEFSKHLYIGGNLQYYRGQDEMLSEWVDSTYYFNPTYRGFSGSVGFLQRMTPRFQIGASIQFPTKLWVNDRFTYSDHQDGENSYSGTWKYSLTRPFVFHIGSAYNTRFFNLFYEAEWTDWSSLKFHSKTIYEADLELPVEIGINNDIRSNFNSTISQHVGAVLHLPMLPLHFYGGYQYLPVPYSGYYDKDLREVVSAGFSMMLNQHFSIHGSWQDYYWKFQGEPEDYQQIAFGVSLHY